MTCWAVIGSLDANLNRLDHWVEQGNPWAAQYLAKHLKQLDGGNLEDALVALGQFSDHDMNRFLLFAKNGLLSDYQFSNAIIMLPLSLSDDLAGQLSALSKRRNKVQRVMREDLSAQKTQALGAIDKHLAEIRSHISQND